jgi:hypothetical protein
MNSLLTNQLSKRFPEWLSVVQRHKDGKIHFHFVVVMAEDIRTGFDHRAVARRDYSSASPYLRAEWKWLRETLPEFSFGRHELLPVKVADGFGRYVARYVAGNTKRQACDSGARLVRFSRSFVRTVCGPFSPFNFIGKRVRARQEELRGKWPGIESLLDNAWLPEARGWLSWVLWSCPAPVYSALLSRVEDDLLYFGGVALAFKERALEFRSAWERELASQASVPSGAGVSPVSSAERGQVMLLPGEKFLARG